MKKVSFMDMAVCLNVHTFIIWEFIRRYGVEKGVKKDRWGRGSVSARDCRKWIDKLAAYIGEQDFTYKHEVNKRSEERRVGKECRSRWSPYH